MTTNDCPLRCIRERIYGYYCPWPGHISQEERRAALEAEIQRMEPLVSREAIGTVGTVLTSEHIRAAVKAMRGD